MFKHGSFKLMALEQNRYGAEICFIHTIKYEFVAILKNQEISHINLYFRHPLGGKITQRPSWQQWAKA